MDDSIAYLVMLLQVVTTLFMVGVIWFVQVVHYPLMAHVGRAQSVVYEQSHTRRTGWVVGLPMLIELGTGFLLLWIRPTGVSFIQALVGVALLAVAWISTQFVQVPCHNRLSVAFDLGVHRRLVCSNWVRTATWSLRGLLVFWMVLMSLGPAGTQLPEKEAFPRIAASPSQTRSTRWPPISLTHRTSNTP